MLLAEGGDGVRRISGEDGDEDNVFYDRIG